MYRDGRTKPAHRYNRRRLGQCVRRILHRRARLQSTVALARHVAYDGDHQLPRQVEQPGLDEQHERAVDGVGGLRPAPRVRVPPLVCPNAELYC